MGGTGWQGGGLPAPCLQKEEPVPPGSWVRGAQGGRQEPERKEGGGCPGAAGTLGGAAVVNGASKPPLAVFPFLPNIHPRSRRMIHSLSTTQHSVHRNGREHWEMGIGSWGRSGSPLGRPLRPDSPRVIAAVPTTSRGTQPQSCLLASVTGPCTTGQGPGACRRLHGQNKSLKPLPKTPASCVVAPHRPPTGSAATHPCKIRQSSKTTLIITSSLIAENN